jgi:multimeric flavodoxin WrbA
MQDAYMVRQTAQLRLFADLAGEPWQQGKVVDNVAIAFTSSQTEHGGQNSTIDGADEETVVVARAQSARLARFTRVIGAHERADS